MNQYVKVFDIQSEIIAEMSEKTRKTKEEVWEAYLQNQGVQNLVRKILEETRRDKPNEDLKMAFQDKASELILANENK